MRPTMITLAIYLGLPLSMATVLMTIEMVDWIRWPLHMLPSFLHDLSESSKAMYRLQKFHMLDETQDGVVTTTEEKWSKDALEVTGNFSWGFINKQEDEDSDEDDDKENE